MITLDVLACVPTGRAFLGGVAFATVFLTLLVGTAYAGMRALSDLSAEADQVLADERDDEPVHVTGEHSGEHHAERNTGEISASTIEPTSDAATPIAPVILTNQPFTIGNPITASGSQ